MTNSPELALSIELIQQASITPDDKNCQNIITKYLSKMGFDCEFMYFGDPNDSGDHAEIKNLWAIKKEAIQMHQSCVLQVIPMLYQQVMNVLGNFHHFLPPSMKANCMGEVHQI